ncbi:hypothetical protein ASC97_22605 [Rhizobium sp. Root1203]|nr:hypothetical protein ASC97_22605 [Rhizobium sp. Root1203]
MTSFAQALTSGEHYSAPASDPETRAENIEKVRLLAARLPVQPTERRTIGLYLGGTSLSKA